MAEFNEKRFYKNVKFISLTKDGIISNTNTSFFPSWKKGTSIYDAHPFFEILKTLEKPSNSKENQYTFPCVHLNQQDASHKICDISIEVEENEINISIFDYTRAYNDLNKVSQERNESIIKSQELAFTNKLLLEKEAFKNEFIANINHEISTPVSSIQGFLELLEKTKLDYEQEELIKIIKKESQHLKRIFSDMLDLSKIELGSFQLTEENFDLVDLLESISSSYTHITKEKALKFIVDIDPKITKSMYGDKTRIYQIINNLLNNSIKYTEDGFIKLTVKRIEGKSNKQKIKIEIEDSGIGIEKENLSSIFLAFTQHNENGEGSGLGLHIVSKLTSLMGGSINVESTINEGSKFTVELKIKHEQETTEDSSKKIQLNKQKKYRVIVVENKLTTQYLIMKLLLNEGVFFIDVVSTAEEAIKAIENRKYDLMILDIKLPGMDGFNLAKTIREKYSDSFIKELPIIAVSALNTPNIKNICASNGIDSFLAKPFTQELFIQKIAKLLNRRAK